MQNPIKYHILKYISNSGDDLRFTAKTTLSKDGQVTATYGPRQEHFTRAEADYTEAVLGLWEITFTSDNPEYESSEPYRETDPCSASAGKSRDRKVGTRTGKSSPARTARWSIKLFLGTPTAPPTPSPPT